ncbi:hypothetical protein NicSoilC12_13670 [Arthrobacter sp. NicSoilC12]|nr:hypothetical protein NicSoilC12_13670 [Arthrobacter sp. NicSoilC12]
MLTHQGKYGARATGDAIAARAKGELRGEPAPWSRFAQTASEHAVPNVVFTDPELANVGRTMAQAEKDGFRASSVELPIQVAGSSLHAEHYEGWAQLVIDEDRKVLLGATFAARMSLNSCTQPPLRWWGSPAGPAVARRALLSDHQRSLAPPAGGVRPLIR